MFKQLEQNGGAHQHSGVSINSIVWRHRFLSSIKWIKPVRRSSRTGYSPLFHRESSGVASCKNTEDDDIRNGIPANSVTAVDTPDHFTGGERAVQGLLLAVQHAGFGVDGHAAHGVVNPRRDAN